MGASNPEQRYALARLVFEAVEVTDDRVATVMPQPDFAPFFVTRVAIEGMLEENENGADEAAPPTEVLHQRKRRGSRQHFQNLVRSGASVRVPVPGPLLGATPASGLDGPSRSRPDAPACCRYRARPRKLTAAQVLDIRALAATRSLRSLAAEFGVSHETIRSALR
ncbi:MAG: hypothetical protein M3Q10_08705 [Chloroflexota bacterium]|nr:hypothetical protein [Chloroflexota bacterium]